MTAREVIGAALHSGTDWDALHEDVRTSWLQDADTVVAAIRGMSHDELRELRPDIATLYDTTKDTANTRADYILNRLHDVETERDELAAKIARVEALCDAEDNWWGTSDYTGSVEVDAIRTALRGNP